MAKITKGPIIKIMILLKKIMAYINRKIQQDLANNVNQQIVSHALAENTVSKAENKITKERPFLRRF